MKIDELLEELEYKKQKHKQLLKLIDKQKLTWREVAEKLWIIETTLSKIKHWHIPSIKTMDKYINILK